VATAVARWVGARLRAVRRGGARRATLLCLLVLGKQE